jgi:peptidoglycan L-alanyl-D-glutamate endopeptidase CwlK
MYKLEPISEKRLLRVEPRLADCVRAAQGLLSYQVRVTCGLRTMAEQVFLYEQGKSRTLKSKHLASANGYSHAVDLVAMIQDEPDWGSERFFEIADAMRRAAIQGNVRVTWGGIWEPCLNDIDGPLPAYRNKYVAAFVKARGRKPFFDAPHFQL